MIQGITSDKFENVIIPVGSARSPYSPYSEAVKFLSPTLLGFLCTTKDIS